MLSTQLITEVLSQGSHLSVRHIWDDGRKPWAINQGTDGNFQLTSKVSERNTPNRLDASLIIELLSSFRFAKFKENRCKILFMDSSLKFLLGYYSHKLRVFYGW